VVESFFGLPTGPTDLSVFRAELTGLAPGTEYEFRVGTMPPVYRFRTMPAKATRAFHFVSGGDCGVNAHAVANNRAAAGQDPMLAGLYLDTSYATRRHRSVSTFASSRVSNSSALSSSSRSFPLNDSTDPFSHGLPSSMNSVLTPSRPSHPRTAFAANSGPLSD